MWFTFTLVQPNGMSGMMMSNSGASMNMTMAASAATEPLDTALRSMMSDTDLSMNVSADQMAMHHHSAKPVAESGTKEQSTTPAECDQHDCCCSALAPISLMPVASLSWLPEHIVNQEIPRTGDGVVHTDGQLRLPFANGPPRTVSA
ncbi:MAG: hypothetical protein ABI120_26095 [Gemmatimonadaceae bacterium]